MRLGRVGDRVTRLLLAVALLGTFAGGAVMAPAAYAATPTWAQTGSVTFPQQSMPNGYGSTYYWTPSVISLSNTVAAPNGTLLIGANMSTEQFGCYPQNGPISGNYPTIYTWNGSSVTANMLPYFVNCYGYPSGEAEQGQSYLGGFTYGPDGNLWAAVSVVGQEDYNLWDYKSGNWTMVAENANGVLYGNTQTPIAAPVSLTPGPAGTVLMTLGGTTSYQNAVLEINSGGGTVQQLNAPSGVEFYGGTLGPDGNIWVTSSSGLMEYNGRSWVSVANATGAPAAQWRGDSYSSPMTWGSDARLWFSNGSEWTGSGYATPLAPPHTTYNVLAPNQNDQMTEVWGSGATLNFYTLQNGPTVSTTPSLSTTLPTGSATWGKVEATTSFNGSSLAAQGYDGNTQDWGNVSFQMADVNPDGGWFNTQTVPGGNVGGPPTSLPTQFGHLYAISAAAQYLDPTDPNVVLGGPINYGPGVNYYLPSNTPGSVQVSAVTATSITVDWPTVWKSSAQQFLVSWEPYSTWQNHVFTQQQSPAIGYPVHSYTITGLSPGTKYAVWINPNEPSGGAPFNGPVWGVTTDSAPSGSLQINGGAPLTSSPNVTLSVTGYGTKTPPVAVRFSQDGLSWGSWQPLSGTPLLGAPAEGAQGATGDYYAANTSLAANQAGTDYMHLNHFMYSEVDQQIDFPDNWPVSTAAPACNNYNQAPQAMLNSGSPTNLGTDFGAIWQGYVYAPVSGTYTFATPSDDGATLDVGGQEVVSDWKPQGMPAPSAESGTITLAAGQWYPFMIQYGQVCGGGGIQFEWKQPSAPSYVPIPSQDLWSLAPSYTDPNSAAIQATGTFAWTFPAGTGGTQTVYAEVLSLDGLVSPVFSASILEPINSTPPIIDMTLNGGQPDTTSTTVPVSLSVQGSGFASGQGQMQFQIDGGTWSSLVPYATSTTVTIPATAGIHTVTAQLVDENGLESQASKQITYQTSQPSQQTGGSGSVITVTNSQGVTLNGETVQVVATGQIQATFSPPAGPNGSLPTFLAATHDGTTWSPWMPFVSSMPITLLLGGVNTLGVQFKYQDTSLSQIYLLPVLPLTTPPSLLATWKNNATATTDGTMTATVTVNDPMVPVTDLQYSVNGGSSWSSVPSASFTAAVPLPTSGDNTVTIEVRDPAGNVASKALTGWSL